METVPLLTLLEEHHKHSPSLAQVAGYNLILHCKTKQKNNNFKVVIIRPCVSDGKPFTLK